MATHTVIAPSLPPYSTGLFEELERLREIKARERRPVSRSDYQEAKKLLLAKIIEVGGDLPENINIERTLAHCLDEALNCDPTDGPTRMTKEGDVLLGPTNEDWAEMAPWVFLSD